MPISDQIIKDYCGKVVNFIELPDFTFGKELQLHIMEIKANKPFSSPAQFEETMQNAVSKLNVIVQKRGGNLIGTGMHPLLRLNETKIWPHYHKKIYQEYGKIFNMKQHGWLNIQSFHLNLPYQKEADAIQIHNYLSNLCAYLPAIAASSPIFEGKLGLNQDNRLQFYKINQKQIPSITGDIIPCYTSSLNQYKREVIDEYSKDLACAGANKTLLNKEWINSRGVIFRFDRRALEVRVMDEQECTKSDVALSCFIRACLRGLLKSNTPLIPHDSLVKDFNAVIKNGLDAHVSYTQGKTAREVCKHYFRIALENATVDEKKYLWLVERRILEGNLSEIIREKVMRRSEKTSFHEAIVDIYSILIKSLSNNEPFF